MFGVCQCEARGLRGPDAFLPHGLGHEGSGRVLETGPGVNKVRAGDPVLLSWMKASGADVPGTVYQWGGRKVNSGAIITFARAVVVSENRLTILPAAFPLREAALFGCAVPTGFGMIFNALRAQPGQSLAVFGVGGVGLSAVAAARLAGCGHTRARGRPPDQGPGGERQAFRSLGRNDPARDADRGDAGALILLRIHQVHHP